MANFVKIGEYGDNSRYINLDLVTCIGLVNGEVNLYIGQEKFTSNLPIENFINNTESTLPLVARRIRNHEV